MLQPQRGLVFLALAIAFLAIGIATNRTFLVLALAFFVIGVAFLRRPRN